MKIHDIARSEEAILVIADDECNRAKRGINGSCNKILIF